jgi:septum formation protein
LLVLASASPRRREILANAGFAFVVRPAHGVDETVRAGESPEAYVRRLAREKALAAPRGADEIVLAADTTVVLDGEILGKPEDAAEATRMLARLAGRAHEVWTGICLLGAGFEVVDAARSRVWFLDLSPAEIAAYIASGEPWDKAGGYGIQGLASKFVDRIEGCYFNVMGLPVSLVYRHLRRTGGGLVI